MNEIEKKDRNIDSDELIERLKKINNTLTNALLDFDAIKELLGVVDKHSCQDEKQDTGKIMNPIEIIRLCEITGNTVRLPKIQFNKTVYAKVKKLFENAGAQWEGNKTQAFVFPFNPERIMNDLKAGKEINIQQDYQFFETPDEIADWMVELAGGISPADCILEPSAGQGAIIKAIHRKAPDIIVNYCEYMPENQEILKNIRNVNYLHYDFQKLDTGNKFSKIIANPPFSKNQDIEHVQKMYHHLTEDGTLVSITGVSWTFLDNKAAKHFREWIHKVNAEVYDLPKGKFKDSGTGIETKIVVIRKKLSHE